MRLPGKMCPLSGKCFQISKLEGKFDVQAGVIVRNEDVQRFQKCSREERRFQLEVGNERTVLTISLRELLRLG